ncbi:MAG: nodulation protein NfeD [Dehalococcoidia bacterium]|nr:nodulation protein NfeD [Dehalococcoidia bacterium]
MNKLGALLIVVGAMMLGLSSCGGPDLSGGTVHLLEYDGNVDPVLERYIERGIEAAEDNEAAAVVIQLDTPGGLLDTTRNIVRDILASDVPVIVWVAPSGSHAASAGTFITIAGHVAAMAPGTNIGAASPVASTGGDVEGTLGEKVENDTAAFIRSIADQRGRNADWAEAAVREAESIGSAEAVELNVIDFQARDITELLELSDGMRVETAAGNVTLGTAGVPVERNDMTLFEQVLSLIADPNIAFLLLSLGGVLLIFGLLNAGTFLPETLGALMLILGFFALSVIPYNTVGVVLLALGLVLLTAELFVPGTGALGIVGALALILGGLFLTSTEDPEFQVSRWIVFITSGLIAAFFILVVQALIRTRNMPVISGKDLVIGRAGRAETDLNPHGKVWFDGELWNATSVDEPVLKGVAVEIVDVSGLNLVVRRGREVTSTGAGVDLGVEPSPRARGSRWGLPFIRRRTD